LQSTANGTPSYNLKLETVGKNQFASYTMQQDRINSNVYAYQGAPSTKVSNTIHQICQYRSTENGGSLNSYQIQLKDLVANYNSVFKLDKSSCSIVTTNSSASSIINTTPGNIFLQSSTSSYLEVSQGYIKEQSRFIYMNSLSSDGAINVMLTLSTSGIKLGYNTDTMFTCVPRGANSKYDLTVYGNIVADNVQSSMTITHETDVSDYNIGRFCESTGLIYSGYEEVNVKDCPTKGPGVGITDCITGIKLATTLTTKILGIMTTETQFASHGDVLVKVIDGEYHLGDLLVPTENGARVATEEEKMFIMLNGLPRVRVMSITDNRIPKLDNQVCVAAFIS
jgi:hypothetical protein